MLNSVHIDIPELPDGFLSPRPGRMYPALLRPEEAGIVNAEFEPRMEDDGSRRRVYWLAETDASMDAIE